MPRAHAQPRATRERGLGLAGGVETVNRHRLSRRIRSANLVGGLRSPASLGLFVQGAPFIRYLLHPLLTKPILGAFAAAVVYAVAQSGLVFGIGVGAPQGLGGALANHPGAIGYIHALLAIACGFAADKVLGDMIGSVLRRLEQKAEKTTAEKVEPST